MQLSSGYLDLCTLLDAFGTHSSKAPLSLCLCYMSRRLKIILVLTLCFQISCLIWININFYRTDTMLLGKGIVLKVLTTVIVARAKILDNKVLVDTFILDLEMAFDIPPHELLKTNLFSYEIGE